ncbi:hypothetical protein ACFY05_32000 [Microtetraspora fusca]|uniref:DUF2637 domain-containing protein n=1 Tax=Microtetraspora fusca TaxID=1997 RepID=A0ABW6VIA1_MICFU
MILLVGAGIGTITLNVWHAVEKLTALHKAGETLEAKDYLGIAALALIAGVLPVFLAGFMSELADSHPKGRGKAVWLVMGMAMALSIQAQAEMLEPIFGELVEGKPLLSLRWLFPLMCDIAVMKSLQVLLAPDDDTAENAASGVTTPALVTYVNRPDGLTGGTAPAAGGASLTPHPGGLPGSPGTLTGQGSAPHRNLTDPHPVSPSSEAPQNPAAPSPNTPHPPLTGEGNQGGGEAPTGPAPKPQAEVPAPRQPKKPATRKPQSKKVRSATETDPDRIDIMALHGPDLVRQINADLATGKLERLSGAQIRMRYGPLGSDNASIVLARYNEANERLAAPSEDVTGDLTERVG